MRSVVIRLIGCLCSHDKGFQLVLHKIEKEFVLIVLRAQEGTKMDPSPLIRDSVLRMIFLCLNGTNPEGPFKYLFKNNFKMESLLGLLSDSSAFVRSIDFHEL